MSDEDATAIRMINERLNRMEDSFNERHDKMEEKIDKLLEFRWIWVGRLSVIAGAVSAIALFVRIAK